jgi:glucose/arabinose dehydrogenase
MTTPMRSLRAGAHRPGRSAGPGRVGLLAAVLTLSLGLVAAACSSQQCDGASAGCGPIAGAAPGSTPAAGTDVAGANANLPKPVAVPSLDGIKLKTQQIADVHEPTALVGRPGTSTLYVAQKDGRIKRITAQAQTSPDGKTVTGVTYRLDNSPILDLSNSTQDVGERGLLGLVFSSDGRKLYVDYTAIDGTVTVDEYQVNDDNVDLRSRRNLLKLPHPENNHNGGDLVLGPDGFLYIAVGDGGGAGDPHGNAQNAKVLYGKILRIDPEDAVGLSAYDVPAGNPFKDGTQGAPEVWAYGLRNPWRFSFDKLTKDLWIGDVGQNTWEEIDYLPAPGPDGGAGRGANLGWNQMEGAHPYNGGSPPAGSILPIYDYDHSGGGCSVTGGYVYRGKAMSDLLGVYLFADYCSGEVQTLLRKPDGTIDVRGTGLTVPNGTLESGGSITSFGQDDDGELFVLSAAGGVYKIVPG